MYSTLITKNIDSPNYSERTEHITKITIHHMAGIMTAEACCNMFKQKSRKASANYCIGKNGEIYGCVPEEKRAWTSGSSWNDQQAITIEVSNCAGEPDWKISDKVMQSLIALCVDICKRHKFKLTFTGDKNGSLTYHYMYQATRCPGEYIRSKTSYIVDAVNSKLSGATKPAVGKLYYVNKAKIYKDIPIITNTVTGTFTIVEERNGYGKLKSGAGWIDLTGAREV